MAYPHDTLLPTVAALGMPDPRWSDDALVREQVVRRTLRGVRGDGDGVLLILDDTDGRHSAHLVGLGDPARVAELLRAYDGPPVTSANLPRGTGDHLGAVRLDALGLVPLSAWEWMVIRSSPAATAGTSAAVERLDLAQDTDAVRSVLSDANPSTDADPRDKGTVGWWGVRGDDGLVGVIGAVRLGRTSTSRVVGAGASATASAWAEAGAGVCSPPWHLRGLGVRPVARGQGVGAALTATAVRASRDEGASWVSLGMYADNDGARRIYHRLGFTTEHSFESYRLDAPR